ncbi:GLUG motif-containing protein [Treponema sp. R80B11-R83G3]
MYELGSIFVRDTNHSSPNLGGVIGYADNGYFKSCYSRALKVEIEIRSVDYASYIGGFVGFAQNSDFTECANVSPVMIKDTSPLFSYGGAMGGFAGGLLTNCTVNKCYSEGSISGKALSSSTDAHFGGFVGQSYGTISKCYATGGLNIVLKGGTELFNIGGLVGQGSATESWASGSVSITFENIPIEVNIGGLIGAGSASNCYALGDVLVDNPRTYTPYWSVIIAGGLVGQGFADHCYARGWVEIKSALENQTPPTASTGFKNYVGGIVGSTYGSNSVNNNVALGLYVKTSGNKDYTYTGRIVGNAANLSNNYASSNMVIGQAEKYGDVVQEGPASPVGAATVNGGDISSTNAAFWTSTMGFSSTVWNTSSGLPKLAWEQ